jgi:tRNA-2-methylthio-N6-dimethylallyladenosine synthase
VKYKEGLVGKEILEDRQGEAMLLTEDSSGTGKKLFLESYGCQMNFSDSELVATIMSKEGYTTTRDASEADVVLINTCAIRENAEQRVRNRIVQYNRMKKERPALIIGMLGCMAERLKEKLLEEEKLLDIVVGPDAYRDLPNLVEQAGSGQKAVNVLLSREETYADINPIRLNSNGVTAYISIMRGCDNMCSFCVVPFTRGRERSRDPKSIVHEAKYLFEQGYREVTLLGQNVDSYRWNVNRKKEIINEEEETVNFAQLLIKVAEVNTRLRVRFSTSHPKDMTDDVLHAINDHENICNYIHLPVQSGNSEILKKMNRGYTREWYMSRIESIKKIIPDCAISTDIISGFCGETDEQHEDTLSLMKWVKYDSSYMFLYSERPRTLAQRKYEDDIPQDVKQKRHGAVVELQKIYSSFHTEKCMGQTHEILIEGISKKSSDELFGRNSQNLVFILPKGDLKPGDYVMAEAVSCSTHTVRAKLVKKI